MRDALFAIGWAVMVSPPLLVFVALMFKRPERPTAPTPQPDKGRMTRSGVPYVMGKTL